MRAIKHEESQESDLATSAFNNLPQGKIEYTI